MELVHVPFTQHVPLGHGPHVGPQVAQVLLAQAPPQQLWFARQQVPLQTSPIRQLQVAMEVAVTRSWAQPHTKFCSTGGHASGHCAEVRKSTPSATLAAAHATVVAAGLHPRFGAVFVLDVSIAPQAAACSFPGSHPASSAPAIIFSAVRRWPCWESDWQIRSNVFKTNSLSAGSPVTHKILIGLEIEIRLKISRSARYEGGEPLR